MTPVRRPAARAGGTAALRVRLLVVAGLGAVALAACGEPTAQIVRANESRIAFELPVEYTDITDTSENGADYGQAYGPPDASLEGLASDPVLVVSSAELGDAVSFQSLRTLATGGQYDPLDASLDALPDGAEVHGYVEINEPDVWGVRLILFAGRGASDFQALVDRRDDDVVITELICTQACFIEQLDLIDNIQRSWTLEP